MGKHRRFKSSKLHQLQMVITVCTDNQDLASRCAVRPSEPERRMLGLQWRIPCPPYPPRPPTYQPYLSAAAFMSHRPDRILHAMSWASFLLPWPSPRRSDEQVLVCAWRLASASNGRGRAGLRWAGLRRQPPAVSFERSGGPSHARSQLIYCNFHQPWPCSQTGKGSPSSGVWLLMNACGTFILYETDDTSGTIFPTCLQYSIDSM